MGFRLPYGFVVMGEEDPPVSIPRRLISICSYLDVCCVASARVPRGYVFGGIQKIKVKQQKSASPPTTAFKSTGGLFSSAAAT
ncbi:hypothetical protein MUK42_35862 [Musa troglodytarum]|uniref:Uncharacterized protein n=1 Tax=Musa troglodytarum TaxID=320322 RepID=A0A9E7JVG0_9LILI|nr:hypothetical protein MUK42_35862 [Musa troglodytarum]